MKTFDLKHKLGDFLLKEEGKISKASILKAGIVLGAIALSVKPAKAEIIATFTGTPDGDCTGVDAKTMATHPGQDTSHTNAAHANNINVKNLFGKLVMGHANCIETHSQHASYYHDRDDSGGGCCSGCW